MENHGRRFSLWRVHVTANNKRLVAFHLRSITMTSGIATDLSLSGNLLLQGTQRTDPNSRIEIYDWTACTSTNNFKAIIQYPGPLPVGCPCSMSPAVPDAHFSE